MAHTFCYALRRAYTALTIRMPVLWFVYRQVRHWHLCGFRRNLSPHVNENQTGLKKVVSYHSVRKLFTGLTLAAFTACIPTVSSAMINAIDPALMKYHHSNSILKAKLSSQYFAMK